MDTEFCQRSFLHLLRWLWNFSPWSHSCHELYLLVNIYWTIPLSLEWSLFEHDEQHFSMFLNWTCQYFVNNFCIYAHQRDWWIVLLVKFCLPLNSYESGCVSPFSMVWNNLRSGFSSLNAWKNSVGTIGTTVFITQYHLLVLSSHCLLQVVQVVDVILALLCRACAHRNSNISFRFSNLVWCRFLKLKVSWLGSHSPWAELTITVC